MEVAVAFLVGAVVGALFALERFMRYSQTIEIKVTPDMVEQLTAQAVRSWLDSRGWTVVPKAKEFKWQGEVTNG